MRILNSPNICRNIFLLLLLLFFAAAGFAENIPLDENLVALFADTHVTTDKQQPHQRAGLSQCIKDVLACNPRPANVLILGDLSFNRGETNDYVLLKELIKPLEDAGVHWYSCPGNHDRREPFLSVFPDRKETTPPVTGRLVTVVKTPHADFILLDSCQEGPVGGALDDTQLTWLQETLSHYSKPVFIGAHHPIAETGVAGLMASNALCAAYIFGHAHAWTQSLTNGVQTLCLPSTGHWGDIGYVMVQLGENDAVFTLHQRDYYTPRPAAKPEDVKPEWKKRAQKNDRNQCRIPLGRKSVTQ